MFELASRTRALPALGWTAAILLPLLALGVRLAIGDALVGYPFLTFFPAVLLTTFVGGRKPGFASAVLSGLLAFYFLIEPIGSFSLERRGIIIALLFYALVSAIIVILLDATHAALARAESAQATRDRSEAELRLLTDSIPVRVSYIEDDPDGGGVRYRFVNRVYEEWFQRRREDIVGRRVRDVLGEDSYAGIREWIELALAGERVSFEQIVPYHDAGRRHIRIDYVPRVGADGTVEGLFALVQDVTQARNDEAALRESEARLRALTDNLPSGMVYQIGTGTDGSERRFLYVSQSHEKLTGIPAEQALADPTLPYRLILPEHRKTIVEAEAAALRERRPFDVQVQFRRADGEVRWCRIISAPREQPDGSLVWDGIQIDVTEQREAQEALRKVNEALEARVLERTAERDQLWMLSEDLLARATYEGGLTAVNPAWTKLLGWPASKLLTDPYSDIIHPDHVPTVVAALEEMQRTGRPTRFENRILTASGEWKPIGWTVSPEPGGTNFIAVGRDLTDDKAREGELLQAQEALRQSQKMEAMGQLTGGVAHDFNNLLTPIVGSLDMLQRRQVGGPREQRLIEGAIQSAERAKTLVQRLLAFARRQPLQASAVDVGRLVDGMADLIASTTGPQIRVVVETQPGLPTANADANQLEMALLNLGVNARDAMPNGGTLRITADLERVAEGHRSKLPPGDYVRLSVADTGVGMDDTTLKRSIEPFFSTKGVGKGTGLGLSMVHGLASQLGGTLVVQSRPGLGTNVELWLPVSAAPAADADAAPADAPDAVGRGTALLVDDEELVRASTADMLSELGYDVAEADCAEAALRLIEGGIKPDVLVTDHLMPGMTGTELAGEIRARLPGVPVLLVSGYADAEGIAPDIPRLLKPFRRAELAASLSGLRNGQAGSA